MSRSSHLTIVVPGALERWANAVSKESLLARVAGRGEIARAWDASSQEHASLNPWQRGLLAALRLDERHHPSAPLTALGMGLEAGEWVHAEPVHFAAGLNEVALVPLRGAAALAEQELDALTPTLAAHFADSGLAMHRGPRGWLIKSPTPWRARTVMVDYARTHEWGEVLPSGDGAAQLRRWMTEAQMLLHDHAVNDARTARGLPAANALWLWGNGPKIEVREQGEISCIGCNGYLRGICRAHSWPPPTEIHSMQELLTVARARARTVAMVEAHDLNDFESQHLTTLLDALRAGAIQRLTLVLDEWRIDIDRWRWRRFWRGALPLTEWSRA